MTLSTPLPDAVQWFEGMLLSPQHFQQTDIYWHAHLRHRMATQNPHYWGVTHLRFKQSNDLITISELECVLPDGLAVQYPGTDYPGYPVAPLDINLAEEGLGSSPKRIWLVVPERGANCASVDNSERRYDSIGNLKTMDENTGDGDLTLERLRPRMKLQLASRAPSPQCAVALLEVVRTSNKMVQITAYHPPLTALSACDFHAEQSLAQRLDLLLQRLWDKATQLVANNSDAEITEEARAARHLACCLPQFSVHLTGTTHPAQIYQALAQVVGQVACIARNPLPLHMKPYQHDDCLPQFLAAIEYIDDKLRQVDTAYETLPFAHFDKHDTSGRSACFARRLLARMDDCVLIELKPHEQQTRAQMVAWLSDALIASDSVMPQLLKKRLPGALVQALSSSEIEQAQLRPQALLFRIKNRSLPVHDDDPMPVFAAEQSLLIQGKRNADMPAEIILYRKKTPAKRVAEVDHA